MAGFLNQICIFKKSLSSLATQNVSCNFPAATWFALLTVISSLVSTSIWVCNLATESLLVMLDLVAKVSQWGWGKFRSRAYVGRMVDHWHSERLMGRDGTSQNGQGEGFWYPDFKDKDSIQWSGRRKGRTSNGARWRHFTLQLRWSVPINFGFISFMPFEHSSHMLLAHLYAYRITILSVIYVIISLSTVHSGHRK